MTQSIQPPAPAVDVNISAREVRLTVKGRPGLPGECISLLRRHAVRVHFLGIQRCPIQPEHAAIRIIADAIDLQDLTNACIALRPIAPPAFTLDQGASRDVLTVV